MSRIQGLPVAAVIPAASRVGEAVFRDEFTPEAAVLVAELMVAPPGDERDGLAEDLRRYCLGVVASRLTGLEPRHLRTLERTCTRVPYLRDFLRLKAAELGARVMEDTADLVLREVRAPAVRLH